MLGSDASHVHEYTPVAGNLGIGPWIVFVRGVAKEPRERVERPGDSAVDAAPASRRRRRVSLVAGRLRLREGPQWREPGRVVVIHGRCQDQALSLSAQSEQPPRMKCCLRSKAEQALFDVHDQIVDRGRPPMPGSGVRAKAGNTGVVGTVDAAVSPRRQITRRRRPRRCPGPAGSLTHRGTRKHEVPKGVRSSLVPAGKPSRRPGRYCIRRSRVFTSAVSWPMPRLARLARDLFRCDHTGSTGFSSGAS